MSDIERPPGVGELESKSKPDFEALRAERNSRMNEMLRKIAIEHGVAPDAVKSTFNPNSCYCACPDGPCEHTWNGEPWESDDGCAWSTTCSRCGITSMSHSMRVGP